MEANTQTVLPHPMKIRAIAFICGAFVMALQMIGTRMIAPFFGNSLFLWGSIISIFLAALSIGYGIGGALADRSPRLETLAIALCAAGGWLLALPSVWPPLAYSLGDSEFLGDRLGSFIVSFILFLPPSVLLGMVSPFMVRLATVHHLLAGSSAGNIYTISTTGSILGTLLTSFYLLSAIGVRGLLFGLGGGLLLVAIWSSVGLARLAPVVIGAAMAGLAVALPHDPSLFVPSSVALEGSRTIHEEDTAYSRLLIFDMPYGGKEIRFMVADQGAQGRWCQDGDRLCDLDYLTFMYLAQLYHPNPERGCILGLGAGIMPYRFYQTHPGMALDNVEIDPDVVRVAREYGPFDDFPGHQTHVTDARRFMENAAGKYDIVWLDVYAGLYLPTHLVTREFFQLLSDRLGPDGVLAMNYIGTLTGKGSMQTRSVIRTMEAVFPQVTVHIPDRLPCDQADQDLIRNIAIIGVKEPVPWSEIQNRHLATDNPMPYYPFIADRRCAMAKFDGPAVVYTDEYAPANIHREME